MSISPRWLIAVNLILLALAAYSASSIAGTALASRLIRPPGVELAPPPPPIELESAKPATYYTLIHTRDIFNSSKPEAAPAPAPAAAVTPLKLKLWGVALNENGRSYSIIEDLGARKQGVFGISAEVPGGATVKAIEWDKVVLLRGGTEEILALESATATRAPVAPGEVYPRTVPVPTGGTIQILSETDYEVPRSEVDMALQNVSVLATHMRAVPHFEGGTAVGFRLFSIRQDSLFDRLGLKNGDIIRNINGEAMNDPTKALALLQQLRDAPSLVLDVTRNQEQKRLTYTIK